MRFSVSFLFAVITLLVSGCAPFYALAYGMNEEDVQNFRSWGDKRNADRDSMSLHDRTTLEEWESRLNHSYSR